MYLEYKVINNKYYNIKEILKSHFDISDRLLVKLKKNNKIFLNNEISYINKEVKIGDIISISLDFEEKSENIVPKKMNLNILFEDNSLLIINKSPNLPVHPSVLHFEDSLSNGVQFYFDCKNIKTKIRPVNRLDKDTSGIVVFAKNQYIQEQLVKQMKNNIFKKEYYAILEGHLDIVSLKIEAPISRKSDSIIEREVKSTGSTAVTYLERIKNFEFANQNLSFVKFKLETGRTHQLRVHSQYIGHSILGDTLYGKPSNLINRQALHAYKIDFIHPISNKNIQIIADIPDDMNKIIN